VGLGTGLDALGKTHMFKTTLYNESNTKVRGRGKFKPRTCHEGPYEEKR